MLRQDSMSNRMAHATMRVAESGGRVTEYGLEMILWEFGIARQKQDYKKKLIDYGYLTYDQHTGNYEVSDASKCAGTIEITVKPSLYAEEVRRHLVGTLAGYADVLEVGDVVI